MEELTLPRPALALWRRTRDTLLAARSGLDDEADGWRLGGGTLLAARWDHRVSTDIDLTVAEASERDVLLAQNDNLLVEPEHIVDASIASMRRSRYEHVAIRCEDDHARIETRTAGRAKQDIAATAGNLEHVFEASGINAYLQGHGSSPDRVRERVAEAIRAGGPGRVIWNSDQRRRPPTIAPPRRFPGPDSH